jgi:hypothetical protein
MRTECSVLRTHAHSCAVSCVHCWYTTAVYVMRKGGGEHSMVGHTASMYHRWMRQQTVWTEKHASSGFLLLPTPPHHITLSLFLQLPPPSKLCPCFKLSVSRTITVIWEHAGPVTCILCPARCNCFPAP